MIKYDKTGRMPEIETATAAEFEEIAAVWEASVRATHDFLPEEDIRYFRPLILHEYLPQLHVEYICDEAGAIMAFSGIGGTKLEMLFAHPDARGKGLGKRLVRNAVVRYGVQRVDVNEQNEQAVGFYLHMGFAVESRSELDDSGKPYPILHLRLAPDARKQEI